MKVYLEYDKLDDTGEIWLKFDDTNILSINNKGILKLCTNVESSKCRLDERKQMVVYNEDGTVLSKTEELNEFKYEMEMKNDRK